MAVTITSRTYYCEYLGVGGGGTTYLHGSVGDRITARIDFYIQWKVESQRLSLNATDDSITIDNLYAGSVDWESEGFRVGDTIELEGTTSDDGTYTIDSIDGATIYVAENITTTETAEEASVYGTTAITAVDFYFNTIENSAPESYLSLTDTKSLQRYYATPVDATSIVSAQNMYVGSDSLAWVSHEVLDPATGETDQATIIGMGISADYKQQFRIEHTFIITPLWLANQGVNLDEDTVPDYFDERKALKHICKIDARFTDTDPEILHTGSATETNGMTAWFKRNAVGKRAEYYLESIAYEDADTAETLDAPDLGKNTKVTAVIKSRTGKFQNTTEVMLGAMFCPLDEEDFTGTETTLIQNLYHDRFLGTLISASQDGENFGTDYQQLIDITCTRDDAETATIVFTISLSATGVEYLEGKSPDNRRDTYWIAIKDPTITETADAQKMAVVLFSGNMDYNQEDDTLLEFTGNGFVGYQYPDTTDTPIGDQTVYPGDPVFSEVSFRIKAEANADGISPTLKSVKMQILAIKTGYDDFILEEKVIDCSTTKKLKTLSLGLYIFPQVMDVDEERGFNAPVDSLFNVMTLTRDTTTDTGTKAGFLLQYGFIVRYEDWQASFPYSIQDTQSAEDIAVSVEEVTHSWKDLEADGWTIVHRFTAVVEGQDGTETTFFSERTLTIMEPEEMPDNPGDQDLAGVVDLLDEDETEEIETIVEDGTTLVLATFSGSATSETTITTVANGDVNWSINGDTTDDVAFDIGDPSGTETLFNAMLAEFYPGFTATVGYSGGQWTITVTAPPPSSMYDGIEPDVTFSGFGSVDPDPFILATLSLPAGATDYMGWLRADGPEVGSIFDSRFASTEEIAETTSPWSAGPDPGDALSTRAGGNVRISIYADKVVLSAYLDSTDMKYSSTIQVRGRVDYLPILT